MISIQLEDITVAYDTEAVLSHFNLAIEHGEFVTIIGSSGCGKTTALKLMNGLLKPESGRVLVNGTDIAAANRIRLRRSIGYVIQEIGLFPHMTVEKNISYVLNLEKKKDKKEIHEKVIQMMEIVGLDREFLGRYPDELSGGQRQRVGIARAFIAAPDILLMDEPFGAVDEITRRKLQEEMKELHRKMGSTVVFITHDIGEALKLGTRVIVMDQGKIIQQGSPDMIREEPATEFVRSLVERV